MKSYGLFMAGTLQTDPSTPSEMSGSFTGSFSGSSAVFTNIDAISASFEFTTYESSSTIIHSGSNVFGDEEADTQQFTGSILNTGSITTTGNVTANEISGSGNGRFLSLGINTAASGVAGAILATNDVVAFASSDERLKENLEPIGSAVDKVGQLTGYTYNWIPMEGVHVYGDMKDVGVIAQEVEKVLPELVSDRENGYKAVKYEKLTAVLIQAVKELSERVKTLEGYHS